MSRLGALFALISAVTLMPFSAGALVLAGNLPIYYAEDIEIVGGLAYVVGLDFGGDETILSILDLSDPTSPVEIGSFGTPGTSGWSNAVDVVGGLAYVTDRYIKGLRIIDVSDPTAPVEIGSFPAQFKVVDVEVVGNYAYLVDQLYLGHCGPPTCGSAFRVIDISNPAAPVQVSERFLQITDEIEVVGDFVYVAGRDLEVIDVSNPAMPVTVAVVPDVYAAAIEAADGHLYTAGGSWDASVGDLVGLEVFNVMDPANPFRMGRSFGMSGDSIDVVDGLAYVSGFFYFGGIGMTVVDISNPTAPRRRGSIYAGPSRGLAVYGDYAYLLTPEGLKVVDLSVLDTPTEVGRAEVEGPGGTFAVLNDVEISDGVAYLAVEGDDSSYPRGLRVIDVTDPAEPAELGGIDTADVVLDVELEGGFAYVAARLDGLRIFDVTTPSAPLAAGGLALPGSTAKLEVVGTTAYVVDQGIRYEAPRKLRVIDVSQPAIPAEFGAVALTDRPSSCPAPDIAVVGKLAYVVCGSLYVVDVSNPAQPTLISTTPVRLFSGSSIHVAEDLAYIGDDGGSFSVFDISDPALPVEVDSVEGGGRALWVEDGFAYSAGEYGLAVHDLTDPLQPVLIGGYPADRGAWRGLAIANGLFFGATRLGGLKIIELGPEYLHPQPVEIAIRAGAEAAAINLASRGVIPVALIGAADFDVAQVDRSTLRFGPASAPPAHTAGGHLAAANGDAYPDLVSHYRIADCGISETEEQACVSGRTFAGAPFKGCGTLAARLPRGRAGAPGFAN